MAYKIAAKPQTTAARVPMSNSNFEDDKASDPTALDELTTRLECSSAALRHLWLRLGSLGDRVFGAAQAAPKDAEEKTMCPNGEGAVNRLSVLAGDIGERISDIARAIERLERL
jgi:hypothetical protein